MAKAARRSLLKSNKHISEFDKIILNYFERVLPGISNRQEQVAIFEKWKEQLYQTTDRSILYSELKDFDFLSWIESKIQSRSFSEMLKGNK